MSNVKSKQIGWGEKMRKLISIFFILIFIFSISACKKKEKPEDQVIVYNMSSDPSTLDPQSATEYSSEIVIMNVFEGLTRLDENGLASEGVAENWESNQDKTEYTFNLRKDAVWANESQTPVTADDFVFGMQRAVLKNTNYEHADKLYCIKNARDINQGKKDVTSLGVTAKGPHTLKINLEYSYEELPRLVATPPFMPCNREFFSSTSGQYGREFGKIITNGPFKIRDKYSWVPYSKLVLAKNTNYKGPNVPKCSGVTFSISNEDPDLLKAISSGKIDSSPISSEDVSQSSEDGLNLVSFKDMTWGIVFNSQDEFFRSEKARKAFLSAVDRQNLEFFIQETFSLTKNIILDSAEVDGQIYRENVGNCDLPEFDPENSKDLIKSVLSEYKRKSLPGVTIVCPDNQSIKSMVSKMIEIWNQTFNSYLNMKPLSSQDLFDTVNSGEYQIAIYGIKANSNNATDFIKIFKSENNNNFAKLENETFDNLLKNSFESLSFKEKTNYLFEAENYLVQQGIFYPLYNESRYFASAKNVSGIIFHPYDKGIDFTKAIKIKN